MASPSEDTRLARLSDLQLLGRYVGTVNPVGVIEWLCRMDRGAAEQEIHDFAAWLADEHANGRRRYSSKTRKRVLSHVRRLIRLAHRFELIPWMANVPLPKARVQNPQDGPDGQVCKEMIETARARGDDKGFRDAAMLSLMFLRGLRSCEVIHLNVRNFDPGRNRLAVRSKGLDGDLESVQLWSDTVHTLLDWLERRGDDDGPLFTSLAHARTLRGERISRSCLVHAVEDYARAVGYVGKCTPHRLRHAAITALLLRTGGNIPAVMDFSRHRSPSDLMVYYDRLGTQQLAMMSLLASGQRTELDIDWRVMQAAPVAVR